ncbi:NUDIX hydrolase [Candidatus Microgenomates bacterium]|nr:MAG: NUDIX hydrolase [Candidatus Microgenomates bacterium]
MLEREPKLVVGVLARYNNKFLLARETLEGGKDYWIIPGGKVEFGETIEEAAKREILEETGIKANNLKFLAYKEAIAPKHNYHTVIFFFETSAKNQKIKDDIEGKVIEARCFTKKAALKLPLVFSAKWLFTKII